MNGTTPVQRLGTMGWENPCGLHPTPDRRYHHRSEGKSR